MSANADRATAAVLRLMVGGIQRMPISAARRLGAATGDIVRRLDRRHPRVALRNLATALPDADVAERRELVRRCFRRQGSLMFDNVRLGQLPPDELCRRLTIEGWEHFRKAEEAGRGVLLITGHLGVHELIVHAVPIYKGPVDIVARAVGKRRVDRVMRRLRRRHGNQLIDKRGAVWGMLESLRRGGRVAIMPDQRVHPNEGIEVPFFGRESFISPFPARVSQRTGAPALPIFAFQEPRGRYRLVAHEPIFPQGAGDAETHRLSAAYLEVIEREIRRRPEEWLWMHERWRRH